MQTYRAACFDRLMTTNIPQCSHAETNQKGKFCSSLYIYILLTNLFILYLQKLQNFPFWLIPGVNTAECFSKEVDKNTTEFVSRKNSKNLAEYFFNLFLTKCLLRLKSRDSILFVEYFSDFMYRPRGLTFAAPTSLHSPGAIFFSQAYSGENHE